ncbi:MAG: redoxin family protein, partial [Muribaculaceae bacterium]|nr:redoxin family protein [Muribaculaceae bacterium]
FGKNGAYYKKYADNTEFVDAVMAHRDEQYAHVDTLPYTDRMKQLLRLNIDCDAAQAQLMAPYYQLVKPDSAYYSFIPALGLGDPRLRWAGDYDSAVSYCSRLYLSDDSCPQTAQIDAYILEDLLATGKLDADETKLVEGMLGYNIDRLPADVLKDSRKRLSDRVSFLCDSLQLDGAYKVNAENLQAMLADDNIRDARKIYNAYLKFISEMENNHGISLPSYHDKMTNDDFSRRQTAFFEANSDAMDALYEKYNDDLQMIFKRHDMAEHIQRFSDITGIDDEDIRQNMIISTYAAMLLRGELLPDEVLNDEIKDFSPVAVAFLTEQNNVQREILGKAVSNVSQMSPDDDADMIILNLVEKHKGKMIFIDIWNTWCGGCLQAMAEHEQVKGDYTDKVAFVYLADETSPEERWNERIKSFTGDHYRLPLDQHQRLMQRFNFHSYPSYIIIGSNGDILCTTNHFHSLTEELDKWLK